MGRALASAAWAASLVKEITTRNNTLFQSHVGNKAKGMMFSPSSSSYRLLDKGLECFSPSFRRIGCRLEELGLAPGGFELVSQA